MSENLDDLIICPKCQSVHKKIQLPHKKVAKCSQCGAALYANAQDVFSRGVAFALTALILFVIVNLFPIITVTIAGQTTALTIPSMLHRLFSDGFIVVGSIVLVVVVIAPLVVILSFVSLALLSYFKLLKKFSKHIILFLIISRQWAMVDIFTVSILVALVKLFGYAQIHFGVSFFALVLFLAVDLFALRTIKPIELWIYFERAYSEK